MTRKEALEKQVVTVEAYINEAIWGFRLTFADKTTFRSDYCASYPSVDVSKPLKRIVTTIYKDETYLYSVLFFFRDGSQKKLGSESDKNAGGR